MQSAVHAVPMASGNRLLAGLPGVLRARLGRHLEPVYLPSGTVLFERGDTPRYVLFPYDCLVSLLHEMENGATGESALVGNEGLVGIAPFMGGGTTSSRAVVFRAGHASRVSVTALNHVFAEGAELESVLLRYTQALITQMAQTAVCNRHHSIYQQLARFLLMSIDRLSGDRLLMTHEAIALLLGVRREGISTAAVALQRKGLIEYRRGRIVILDRHALEGESCECYQVVKREYARLLGDERPYFIPRVSQGCVAES